MHQGFPSSQRGRSVPSARRRIRSPARERERATTANPRASRRPERRSHRAGVDDEALDELLDGSLGTKGVGYLLGAQEALAADRIEPERHMKAIGG